MKAAIFTSSTLAHGKYYSINMQWKDGWMDVKVHANKVHMGRFLLISK
jgi:hypothetical protein